MSPPETSVSPHHFPPIRKSGSIPDSLLVLQLNDRKIRSANKIFFISNNLKIKYKKYCSVQKIFLK